MMFDACMAEGGKLLFPSWPAIITSPFSSSSVPPDCFGDVSTRSMEEPFSSHPGPGHGKLRPKAAEQQRPSKLKPPGKTGGCRPLPTRTVGGTNHKAKKGNSMKAVRTFPDGCQGMA